MNHAPAIGQRRGGDEGSDFDLVLAEQVVASQSPLQLEESIYAFPAWLLIGVPLAVVALTTLAALYPARRAARIDPIAALRQR